MGTIDLSFRDGHAAMALDRLKANAMDGPLVYDMREAFAQLAAFEIRTRAGAH